MKLGKIFMESENFSETGGKISETGGMHHCLRGRWDAPAFGCIFHHMRFVIALSNTYCLSFHYFLLPSPSTTSYRLSISLLPLTTTPRKNSKQLGTCVLLPTASITSAARLPGTFENSNFLLCKQVPLQIEFKKTYLIYITI